MENENSHISTYPVGLLHDLLEIRARVKHSVAYLVYQLKRRKWREARNYFNGYLAEWHYPPEGVLIHRAGRGWTRRAAVRRLGVHIATVNAPEFNTNPRRKK